MAGTLERKVLQPGRHPEVHPDIHPDVHPDVDEFIRRTLDEHETGRPTRRPVRWMRWLAAGFIALVGVGVAIWALPGDEPEYAVPRTADGTEAWIEYAVPEYAVPQTADGTVRWMTYSTDYAVPRTADGRVGWFEYLTPQVPQTADGTEGWLLGVESHLAPVMLRFLPMTQVPDGVTGEVSFLPVSPPRTVVPGVQVELTVQPVFRPAT